MVGFQSHILGSFFKRNDTLDDVVKGLFDEYPKDSTMEQSMKSWIDDEKCMPPFNPIQVDHYGGEWVVLQGYDTRKEMMILKKNKHENVSCIITLVLWT